MIERVRTGGYAAVALVLMALMLSGCAYVHPDNPQAMNRAIDFVEGVKAGHIQESYSYLSSQARARISLSRYQELVAQQGVVGVDTAFGEARIKGTAPDHYPIGLWGGNRGPGLFISLVQENGQWVVSNVVLQPYYRG